MVSEPKPHQVNRKRQNLAPDPFATPRQMGSPVKRARTEPLSFRPATVVGNKAVAKKKLQTYAEPDILICGNCREVFPGLQKLLEHKRHRCRLRFTCRCQVVGLLPIESSPGIPSPVCAQCLARCTTWWELACHLEAAHGMSVYHHTLDTAANLEDQDPKSAQTDHQMESPSNDVTCEEGASVASDSRSEDWASLVTECTNHNSNGTHSVTDFLDEGLDRNRLESPPVSSLDTVEKGVDTTDLQPGITVEQP